MSKLNRTASALLLGAAITAFSLVHSAVFGAKANVTTEDLAGKWAAACHKSSLLDNNFMEETFEFGPNQQFFREIRKYSERTCTTPTLTESRVIEGTYEVGAPVKAMPEARELNFTIKTVSSTAYGEAAEKQFNESKQCNVANWKRGEKRDVTGLLCNGNQLNVGTVVFDIVQLADGKLYFGKKSFFRSGDSPKERPKELDKDLVFTSASAMAH